MPASYFVAPSPPGRTWLAREGSALVVLVAVAVVLLSVIPLARLIYAAVAPAGTLSLAPLATLFGPDVGRATINTLVVGVGSSILALTIAGAMVLLLVTTDVRGKRAMAFLFVLSLMVAPQVAALAYKTLAGPASPLLKLAGLAPPPGTRNPMLGPFGIILVMGFHHAPLAAITLAAGLAAIPKAIIETALLDAGRAHVVVGRIVLPLLRPYVIAATLAVFVAGIGNFGIPALLGLPVNYTTLPTLVYKTFASFGPAVISNAAAASLLIAALCGAGVLAAARAMPRDNLRLVADERMPVFWRLGRWRWPVTVVAWAFVATTILLPIASLLATSVVPAYGVRLSLSSFTLAQFQEVLFRQSVTPRAFRNSFLFAGSAALVLAVAATLIAYVLDRRLARHRGWLMALIEIPYAIPGIVLAIACILLFLKPLPLVGVSLYATPWIIVFAYLARFLALALRPSLAAMATVAPDQEEAAAVAGARLTQRLRYIVIPRLMAPAAAGGLMVFLLAFNELTVSALLWSAGTETIGVALLSLEDAGLASEAAAIGVTATVVVALLMLVLDRLAPWLPDGVLPWRLMAPPA